MRIESRKDILRQLRISLLIGVIIALSSQLYLNMFVDTFRISAAVVILPVSLLTVGLDCIPLASTVTAIIIFLFRWFCMAMLGQWQGGFPGELIPNAMFYFVYGQFLYCFLWDRKEFNYPMLLVRMVMSELVANLLDLGMTTTRQGSTITDAMAVSLICVAIFRSLLAWMILVGMEQYRSILSLEEEKRRYQSLFMMITGLKNEIYFMKKNSEEIEDVMGQAYRLHERLEEMDADPELKKMSLKIARDVHEVKKDYLRIIQGIQLEIREDAAAPAMTIGQMMQILEATSRQLMVGREAKIEWDFSVEADMVILHHYELMAVLKNIVGNAMEAIEGQWNKRPERPGLIKVQERKVEDDIVFRIKDNGPGISDRHLPHIFRMGYSTKFDPATGDIFRGVGLYGVKMTVEETFGGQIEVRTEKGVGTVFIVTIPEKNLRAPDIAEVPEVESQG